MKERIERLSKEALERLAWADENDLHELRYKYLGMIDAYQTLLIEIQNAEQKEKEINFKYCHE